MTEITHDSEYSLLNRISQREMHLKKSPPQAKIIKNSRCSYGTIVQITQLSVSPLSQTRREAVGDLVGSESLSHELHVLVEVALVPRELGFHSFPSSQPIRQSTQRLCCDVWVSGLLSAIHGAGSRD